MCEFFKGSIRAKYLINQKTTLPNFFLLSFLHLIEIHQISMLYEVVSQLIVTEMRMNKKPSGKKQSQQEVYIAHQVGRKHQFGLEFFATSRSQPIVVVIYMGSFLLQLLRFRFWFIIWQSNNCLKYLLNALADFRGCNHGVFEIIFEMITVFS